MSSNTQHCKNTNKIPAHQGTFTEAASCITASVCAKTLITILVRHIKEKIATSYISSGVKN